MNIFFTNSHKICFEISISLIGRLFNGSSGSLRNSLQFFPFPPRQNFLVNTYQILHNAVKYFRQKGFGKSVFSSKGIRVFGKLSFGTFNLVMLIFGGMSIRKNHISVISIRENDQELLQIFNSVISPVVCTYVAYGRSFKINLKQNNQLEIRLIN